MIEVKLDDTAKGVVAKALNLGSASMFDNWIMPTRLVADMLQDAYEEKKITKIDLLPLFNKYKSVYKYEIRQSCYILLHRLEEFSWETDKVVLNIRDDEDGVCLAVGSSIDDEDAYKTTKISVPKGATAEEIIDLVCKSISSEDLSNLVENLTNKISSMAGTGPNYTQRNVCIELSDTSGTFIERPISMKDLFSVFGLTLD